jgi:hypothetical protein
MLVSQQRVFGFHWTKDLIHLSIVHRGGKSNTLCRDIGIQTHVAAVSTMLKFSPEASGIFRDMILKSMLPNLLIGMMFHLQAKEGQTQHQK